jgi:hypothetical protein
MHLLAMVCAVLLVAGLLLYAAGWVGLFLEAFRESIVWGLLVFLIPPVTLLFAIRHWKAARFPALCVLGGAGLMLLGFALSSVLPIRW